MTPMTHAWTFWMLHAVQALAAAQHGHDVAAACYALMAMLTLLCGDPRRPDGR